MKNVFRVLIIFACMTFLMSASDCESTPQPTADEVIQQQTEQQMAEQTRELGLPSITNYTEKKNLKWIYELCDQEDLLCHAYFFNEMKGEIGQYLGPCIGYGIPYSTQYSNPEKLQWDQWANGGGYGIAMPQAEPNGLFKPEGMSATWLLLIDPITNKPRPVYIEPTIIVSPFKLH